MTNMAKAKRSTQGGKEVELDTPFGTPRRVPSWVAVEGASIDEAAASIGLRVIGRRETAEIVAEIHERFGGSYWCVKP